LLEYQPTNKFHAALIQREPEIAQTRFVFIAPSGPTFAVLISTNKNVEPGRKHLPIDI